MKPRFTSLINKKKRLRFALGNLIARCHGASIGTNTKIDFGAQVIFASQSTLKIGNECLIHTGVILAPHKGGSIVIGNNCSINPYSILYGHGGLIIGDRVRIAAHSVFIPANHQYETRNGSLKHIGLSKVGICIGNDVWIGTGVRILDGVRIADNIIVGAGSVVTKSLDTPGVYAGVPAQFIKSHKSTIT